MTKIRRYRLFNYLFRRSRNQDSDFGFAKTDKPQQKRKDKMSKTRYVLDYSLTVLKEDNFGICHSSTNLAKSVCEISKEEAAHFVKFCVDNDLHELKKTKVSIKNEER